MAIQKKRPRSIYDSPETDGESYQVAALEKATGKEQPPNALTRRPRATAAKSRRLFSTYDDRLPASP